jgi:enoyl-CoA hydratase/carnithine racemase
MPHLNCALLVRVLILFHSYGSYLALTGRRVTGDEAVILGLATHFVHSSRIPVSFNLNAPSFSRIACYTF